MTIKEFIQFYDLKEIEIESIEYKDNSIYLICSWDIEIEYMANGCRPEFDEKAVHLFIFSNQEPCIEFKNKKDSQYILDYDYDGEELTLILTNQELKIRNCEIIIKQNITF